MQLTPCAYCGEPVEHPSTDRIRYSSDGDKQRAMIVNGVVVHECEDFSGNLTRQGPGRIETRSLASIPSSGAIPGGPIGGLAG